MRRVLSWLMILAGVVVVALASPELRQWASALISLESPNRSYMSRDAFVTWAQEAVNELSWRTSERKRRLTRRILQESLDHGRDFMINNQTPAGNFNYEYDFVKRELTAGDSQVRQAGAAWGLSLIYQFTGDTATREALDRALTFFFRNTRAGPVPGSLLIAYPGDPACKTGTVALVALAIIEYLRAEKDGVMQLTTESRSELTRHLSGYIKFLRFMRRDNGHFAESFSLRTNTPSRRSNPYFDGESLLCLIKAAKYLGYTDLIPQIEESAFAMAQRYMADAWKREQDSPQTKGFYQWGSMAFWEYQDAGWTNAKALGDCVLVLAWWMIYTHETLARTRNTAYAYEGIIHAYRLARTRRLQPAIRDLGGTIDEGLYKLTRWQVAGPLSTRNPFLIAYATDDPLAVGGVMNHRAEAPLRIDVTQHQMHAVILALKDVYTEGAEH